MIKLMLIVSMLVDLKLPNKSTWSKEEYCQVQMSVMVMRAKISELTKDATDIAKTTESYYSYKKNCLGGIK